jgi:hypothetical protein
MDTPADCSLCYQPFLTLMQLRRHMGQHHEQLALFAVPSNFEETEEDDSEAESNNEAEKESISSRRTNSEADEDETASSQESSHDGQTKVSEELALALAEVQRIYELNPSLLTPENLFEAKRIIELSMLLPDHYLKRLTEINPVIVENLDRHALRRSCHESKFVLFQPQHTLVPTNYPSPSCLPLLAEWPT